MHNKVLKIFILLVLISISNMSNIFATTMVFEPYLKVVQRTPDAIIVRAKVIKRKLINDSQIEKVKIEVVDVLNGELADSIVWVSLIDFNSYLTIKDEVYNYKLGSEWIFTINQDNTVVNASHMLFKNSARPLPIKNNTVSARLVSSLETQLSVKDLKRKLAEVKKGFPKSDIRHYLSLDGSELNYYEYYDANASEGLIGDVSFLHLEKGISFRDLITVKLTSYFITDDSLKFFYDLPIENLYLSLNEKKVSKDAIDSLLSHLPKIKSINLASSNLSDEGLVNLSGKYLKELIVYGTQITNKGLQLIAKFKSLEKLNIPSENLTNEGYKHLSKLSNLRELVITEDEVNNETISYISDLPLRSLSIYSAGINNDALKIIGNIKTLRHLSLTKCDVSDVGVKYLDELAELETIYLGMTNITDNSMSVLKELPKLKNIYMSSTKITDKGFLALKDLPDLHHISIRHTEVTRAGLTEFQLSRPKVSIIHTLHE